MEVRLGSLLIRIGKPCISPFSVALPPVFYFTVFAVVLAGIWPPVLTTRSVSAMVPHQSSRRNPLYLGAVTATPKEPSIPKGASGARSSAMPAVTWPPICVPSSTASSPACSSWEGRAARLSTRCPSGSSRATASRRLAAGRSSTRRQGLVQASPLSSEEELTSGYLVSYHQAARRIPLVRKSAPVIGGRLLRAMGARVRPRRRRPVILS